MNRQQLAKFGQEQAFNYLTKIGYHFLEANFSSNYGEIDLIFLSPRKEHLVIVEVKTRYTYARVLPKEAVTDSKIAQLKRTTLYYKKEKQNSVPDSLRIDVIAILVNPDDTINKLEHLENITL